MSSALNNFRNGFLNANSWEQRKDGVPFYLLDKLNDEEKKIAEDELINSINPADSWPVSGLTHLRSQKALTNLYQLLPKTKKLFRVTVAHSIFSISEDRAMIQEVLEEIPRISNTTDLIESLYLLPTFKDSRISDMLEKFRDHEEYLIAYNATRALNLPTEPVVEKFRNKKMNKPTNEMQNKSEKTFLNWFNENLNPFYRLFPKRK